jgi:hypothetical protein
MLVRKITGHAVNVPNIGPVALTVEEAQRLVAQLAAAGLLSAPPPPNTAELDRLRRELLASRQEVAALRAASRRERRAA